MSETTTSGKSCKRRLGRIYSWETWPNLHSSAILSIAVFTQRHEIHEHAIVFMHSNPGWVKCMSCSARCWALHWIISILHHKNIFLRIYNTSCFIWNIWYPGKNLAPRHPLKIKYITRDNIGNLNVMFPISFACDRRHLNLQQIKLLKVQILRNWWLSW